MQMLDAQNRRDDERQKATLMITSLVAQTMESFARRLVSNARTTHAPFSVERAQLECQLLRLQIEEKKNKTLGWPGSSQKSKFSMTLSVLV